MWPRICEVLLALWLLVSPAVLPADHGVTGVARIAGAIMLVASLASLADRFRRAYLITLGAALVCAGYPFLHPPPASPMMQNLLITALVIAMFAIIPPDAMRPPRGWRRFGDGEGGSEGQRT